MVAVGAVGPSVEGGRAESASLVRRDELWRLGSINMSLLTELGKSLEL